VQQQRADLLAPLLMMTTMTMTMTMLLLLIITAVD